MPPKAPRYTLNLEDGALYLDGPKGRTTCVGLTPERMRALDGKHPPSVTEIIKLVFSDSAGGMSFWAYKLGVAALHPAKRGDWDGDFKNAPPAVETLYRRAMATGFHPNGLRDKAGDRGDTAHDRADDIAQGKILEEPATMWEQAVDAWFDEQMNGWEIVASEQQVYQLAEDPIFVGTTDQIRVNRGLLVYEIVDFKTHKPPARFPDFVQIAAYERALWSMNRTPPRPWEIWHRVVLAKKDGTYDQSVKYIDPDVWPAVMTVYGAMTSQGEEVK